MGKKNRVCGKRCHNAKRPKCLCWCGGLFHGGAGEAARDAFKEAYAVDTLPTMEHVFDKQTLQRDLFGDDGDRWRAAIRAAREPHVDNVATSGTDRDRGATGTGDRGGDDRGPGHSPID